MSWIRLLKGDGISLRFAGSRASRPQRAIRENRHFAAETFGALRRLAGEDARDPTRMNKIIITGFMGSGKSSVARALARLLHCDMLDLDDAIFLAEGRPAATIIQEEGEPRFRQLEQQALIKLLQTPGAQVVALGGGAWISEANRKLVAQQQGISVWLDAPFSLCWQRSAAADALRPLAPNETAAFELFSERTSRYELADLRVAVTEQKSANEIAAEIAEILTKREFS